MTTASLEMRLTLFADTDGDLIVGLDGKTIGRVRWLDNHSIFQAETADRWRTAFHSSAASALADLFGPLAPAILNRIRAIEEQSAALRTFEELAPLRKLPEPDEFAEPEPETEPEPEEPTGPKQMPSLPAFGAMPPK